jgi:hypothetical protein
MPLPEPQARQCVHTRQIVYRCYRRDDGLWDVEGQLSDIKGEPYLLHARGIVPPLEPIHDMGIRVTLDDSLTIKDIATRVDSAPFGVCSKASDPMRAMIGVTIGRGWRKAIEQTLGGVKGCTHLRDLLLNLATPAFQTIPAYWENRQRLAGVPQPIHLEQPPHYIGKCMTWAFDGPTVKQYVPAFYMWKPPQRTEESR